MLSANWHWMGRIDCFGIHPEQRDELFATWHEIAVDSGSELQIMPVDGPYDTDRYELHARWTSHAPPFPDLLLSLLVLLPPEHVEMQLQGYNFEAFERQDAVIREGKLYLVPYEFTPGDAVEYELPQYLLPAAQGGQDEETELAALMSEA